MPRSCLLTTHSLAAGVRALFERIDGMRAYACVAFVNLVLLRNVVVQRAQRLGLHPNPFQLVEAVVCDVTAQLHGDCNLLQVHGSDAKTTSTCAGAPDALAAEARANKQKRTLSRSTTFTPPFSSICMNVRDDRFI